MQVSKMNAMLTASIGGFTAGMRQAGNDVGGFASSFKSAAGIVAGAAATIGAGLSVGAVSEYLKSTFEAIDANAHLAQSIGVSSQALGHLEYSAKLAGVASDQLATGLQKMLKNIDMARDGSKAQADAFQKLGLSVKDLAGLQPDQAFAKIGQALSQMTDPAARANATIQLFGRSGAALLPVLTEGTQKLGEQADEADRFGVALNDIDTAKVENAHESFARVEEVIQGAADKLIVAMAPYLDAIAQKLVDVSQDGQGMAQYLVSGFESVTKGIAYAADGLQLFESAWDILKSGAEYAIAGIEFALDEVLKGLNKVLDYFHVSHDFLTQYAADVEKTHQDLMDSASKAWDEANKHAQAYANGDTSAKVAQLFDGIKTKAQTAAQATVDAHQKLGALAADSDLTKEDKSSEQAAKKMADEAKRLFEETRTPLEKYQEQIDKINDLYQNGAIDIDTYSRALNKAEDAFDNASKSKEKFHHIDVDAPTALEAGSSSAADFVAKFQAQAKENEHERQTAANTAAMKNDTHAIAERMKDAAIVHVMSF